MPRASPAASRPSCSSATACWRDARDRLLGRSRRGQAVRRQAEACGPVGDGLGHDARLLGHRQRGGSCGPPPEGVGQRLGGLLPGGEGGEGVPLRKPLDADRAGEGGDCPIGVQAGDAGVRIVIARVHLEAGLPRRSMRQVAPRGRARGADDRFSSARRTPRARGADAGRPCARAEHGLFCIKSVEIVGCRPEVEVRSPAGQPPTGDSAAHRWAPRPR